MSPAKAGRPCSMCRTDQHALCASPRCACGCAKAAGRRGGLASAEARNRPGQFKRRPFLRKEDAECCTSRIDDLGRLPIGFCSPECERRPR